MREERLNDYLILLSIYQTCRYKEVSFLKFLLSRERDVDAFCAKAREERSVSQLLKVYPKGFIPPHLKRFREKAMAKQSARNEESQDNECTVQEQPNAIRNPFAPLDAA
jgi:hypothetical protein